MLVVAALNIVVVNADTVETTQKAISNNKNETDKLLKDIVATNAANSRLQQQISANSTKIEKNKDGSKQN